MKIIKIEIRDPAALNNLDFIDTKDKGYWYRGEEHEGMIEITNKKNNLTLHFTFTWEFKPILVRWLEENLFLYPHRNSPQFEEGQRREEELKNSPLKVFLKEYTTTINISPPPPSKPAPPNRLMREFLGMRWDTGKTVPPGGFE